MRSNRVVQVLSREQRRGFGPPERVAPSGGRREVGKAVALRRLGGSASQAAGNRTVHCPGSKTHLILPPAYGRWHLPSPARQMTDEGESPDSFDYPDIVPYRELLPHPSSLRSAPPGPSGIILKRFMRSISESRISSILSLMKTQLHGFWRCTIMNGTVKYWEGSIMNRWILIEIIRYVDLI